MLPPIPLVPVSWGEVIDKITILEIKSQKITAASALANVRKELKLLTETIAQDALTRSDVQALKIRLAVANRKLWDIEDHIREKEAAKSFDAEFIELARSVYFTNSERSQVKREINECVGSGLTEEKSYSAY
jgi:hypothetical protein